jgi:hypothetical protein
MIKCILFATGMLKHLHFVQYYRVRLFFRLFYLFCSYVFYFILHLYYLRRTAKFS